MFTPFLGRLRVSNRPLAQLLRAQVAIKSGVTFKVRMLCCGWLLMAFDATSYIKAMVNP
jgi:hypothetical protein